MKKKINERRLAYLALLDYYKGKGYITDILDSYFKEKGDQELKTREKAFIYRLTKGLVKTQIYLDYIISHHSKIAIEKHDIEVLIILRMGVYQKIYMDRVPDHAIVNESVKLIKRTRYKHLAAYVNAVLRNIRSDRLEDPIVEHGNFKGACILYSFPYSLMKILEKYYSQEVLIKYMEVSNQIKPLSIMANHRITSYEKLFKKMKSETKIEKGIFLENIIRLKDQSLSFEGRDFKMGKFQVIDESSALVAALAYSKQLNLVLDLCAAPGGKSIYLSDIFERGQVGAEIQINSYDISEKKCQLIRENIARLNIDNIKVETRDARVNISQLNEIADCVIVDVPCSGLGVLRGKPENKYSLTEDKIEELVSLQRQILMNAISYVKRGGYLIYSTCTINPRENQDQLKYLLKKQKDCQLEDLGKNDLLQSIMAKNPQVAQAISIKDGMVSIFPIANGPDGFFIGKILKK